MTDFKYSAIRLGVDPMIALHEVQHSTAQYLGRRRCAGQKQRRQVADIFEANVGGRRRGNLKRGRRRGRGRGRGRGEGGGRGICRGSGRGLLKQVAVEVDKRGAVGGRGLELLVVAEEAGAGIIMRKCTCGGGGWGVQTPMEYRASHA